jgi:hypothetical protein
MSTVNNWASSLGADYSFIDDHLFDYVPDWYKEKVNNDILPVSDLARLEVAKELLSKGYDRAIWIDADVLVFHPQLFTINITGNYAFCREVWLEKLRWKESLLETLKKGGGWHSGSCDHRVNNSVAVFVRGNLMLDFYIDACKFIIKDAQGDISRWSVGTYFLTNLYRVHAFPLLNNVGLFSPPVLRDLANGKGPYLRVQTREFGTPVYAANLCGSSAGKEIDGKVIINDQIYEQAIDKLMATKGAIVNRHLNNLTSATIKSE